MTYAKTQEDLADALGVSRRTISTWRRKPDFPKRSARGWHIGCVHRWRESLDAPDDPLMAGVVSPALERYRMARAKLAELELRQKRQQLLPKDAVLQGLAVFASTMRGAFDVLQRQFGAEAFAIVAHGLDDAEMIFQRSMGNKRAEQ